MLEKYLLFQSEAQGDEDKQWRQYIEQISFTRENGYKHSKLNIFIDLPDYQQELD